MIRINIDGGIFHVEFRHKRENSEGMSAQERGLPWGIQAVTTCSIIAQEDPSRGRAERVRFVALGTAICLSGDNFSRRTGRGKAFRDALMCGALAGVRHLLHLAYLRIDSPAPPPAPPAPRAKLDDAEKRARWSVGWEKRMERARKRGEGIQYTAERLRAISADIARERGAL